MRIAGNPGFLIEAILCIESGTDSIPVTHRTYYYQIPFLNSIYN